ncbi:hypothetical protein ACIBVL_25875 [Streptomyces sp. NPDC049687]|uniref:hypothetical protein n=1 Tax=Streptomyces sp. NPDC049687 TaxID=3365596 RepID=UPI0037B38321
MADQGIGGHLASALVPLLSSKPVRGFTWRAKQKHRPGLEFLVSTGRKHGFESLEERAALLALDFITVIEVIPQRFALTFEHVDGHAGHIPDFLAVMGDGGHSLLDVRPAELVGKMDAVKFAASREAAAVCGWRHSVGEAVEAFDAVAEPEVDALPVFATVGETGWCRASASGGIVIDCWAQILTDLAGLGCGAARGRRVQPRRRA